MFCKKKVSFNNKLTKNKKKASFNKNNSIKFIWPENKRKIHRQYILTDGLKKKIKIRTKEDFELLLKGRISEYLIEGNYSILYNNKSNEGKNQYIPTINGPIIVINKNNND